MAPPPADLLLMDPRHAVRVALDERANGPRLLVEDLIGVTGLALCPLELEALVWAPDDAFAVVTPDGARTAAPHPQDDEVRIRVANEFSTVVVRRADGPVPGLVVTDVRSGGATCLPLAALRRLAACGHDDLAVLVAGAAS